MFKFVYFFNNDIFFRLKPSEGSIYDYEVKSITGENIKLADFKNKVILLVSTPHNAVLPHNILVFKN